jgi:hypothetical protein
MENKNSIKLSSYLDGEYTSYSGQGLNGRSCPGFVYDNLSSAVADILTALHDKAYDIDFNLETDPFDLLYEELKHVEFDLIGLRTIAYFPYLPAEEDLNDDK